MNHGEELFADWLEHAHGIGTPEPANEPPEPVPIPIPEPLYDILDVSPEQWTGKPQRGSPRRLTWDLFVRRMSWAPVEPCKEARGAWSPGRYRDNVRRKENVVCLSMLVFDVDENGDVDRVADKIKFRSLVHSTFSNTAVAPRCRIALPLIRPVHWLTYETAHARLREFFTQAGIIADGGAKDASRVSFFPARPEGGEFRVRVTEGELLDAQRAAAAFAPPPATVSVLPSTYRGDRYVAGALRRAVAEVSGASEGMRHYTLSREAYGLARLGLTDAEIESHLLPAFVGAAGRLRQREGERTIRDALRARRRA